MTYKEYKDNKQAEFNALPLFFALTNGQFKKEMEKRGLTEDDTDKIFYSNGAFYLRTDAPLIREFYVRQDAEFHELMKIPDFAISAFEYEMENHEYSINWQGDFDVCNAICDDEPEYYDSFDYKDYLAADHHEEWIPFYEQAKKIYFRKAEENDWF